MAAAIKGYRCIFVMPDKMSHERFCCAPAARGDHRRRQSSGVADEHYVSNRLAERSRRIQARPVLNMASTAHRGTGPEIWEQTNGELDALVVALGTGGTLSGTAGY
jgi:cystathionine beta-synthase